MTDEHFMHRCFDLARLGAGRVSPNPLVGAVLVHKGRIIGEGWHRQYGQAHAEVNAAGSVKPADRHLFKEATLYVSLEPCCIHRNTPPCTDLILSLGIPRVVVSCLDKSPEVNGRGIEILKKAGVEVITGVLEEEGVQLSRFRSTFVTKRRPYVLLKFARSKDGFMGYPDRQIWISNRYSKRLVHKSRSEYDAILVGTNTAHLDNPQLTNRLWHGKSPLRIVLDRTLRLQATHHLFDGTEKTVVVTEQESRFHTNRENVTYLHLPFDDLLIPRLMEWLYHRRISSLMVEGGAATLKSFLAANCWDEANVVTADKVLGHGIEAPLIPGILVDELRIGSDLLTNYRNPAHRS